MDLAYAVEWVLVVYWGGEEKAWKVIVVAEWICGRGNVLCFGPMYLVVIGGYAVGAVGGELE